MPKAVVRRVTPPPPDDTSRARFAAQPPVTQEKILVAWDKASRLSRARLARDLARILGEDATSPLVEALAPVADPLHIEPEDGRFGIALELEEQPRDAESAIASFVNAIEQLPAPVRAHWRGAMVRDFNIGVIAGDTHPALGLRVSAGRAARVATLGGSIAVTVHPTGGE